MATALFFTAITLICYVLALAKGPIWGLVAYANVYFNSPNPWANWWGEYIPNLRWSLLSFGVLVASTIIHREKLSRRKLGLTFYLIVIMFIIIEVISITVAVAPLEAQRFAYWMLGYCIMAFLMIKILSGVEELRLMILVFVVMGGLLGLEGYLWGKYMDGRLNNIGPADALGSNELGVLLGSILPFLLPFFFKGRKYEKIICFLSFPFILNGFTLTVSRGALVALGSGILYSFIFVANRTIKKYIVYGAICLTPAFFYFVDDGYINRVSSLWQANRESDAEINSLSSGRVAIWGYGSDMVNDYPFGAGPGGFQNLARFYMPEEILTFHEGREYGIRAAHNTYLEVLVELGYLGITCFLLICFSVLYGLWKSSKILKQIGQAGSFVDLLVIGLNISFVCTLFGGLTGNKFYYEFFWFQIAIVVVVKSLAIDMQRNYLKNDSGLRAV